MNKLKFSLLKIIVVLSLFVLLRVEINAEVNISPIDSWNIDDATMKEQGSLREIKSINFFQVGQKSDRLTQNCENYIQSIYRFWKDRVVNLSFPFHYIICGDGRILRTNNLTHDYGVDFLTFKDSVNMLSLQDFNTLGNNNNLLSLLSALEIDKSNLSFKTIKAKYDDKFFVKDFDIINVEKINISGFDNWQIPSYNNLSGLRIKAINAIRNDKEIDVTIKLQNDKLFTFMTSVEKNNLYIKPISNAVQSPYYLDENTWPSFKIAYLSKDESISPANTTDFIFKLKSVTSGTQKFVIVNLSLQGYSGTEFEINFNDLTTKFNSNSDVSVPMITDKVRVVSPFGYLNVRSQPNTNSQVLGRVFTGAEYEILENSGLWYKIQSENSIGWILKSDSSYNYLDIFR